MRGYTYYARAQAEPWSQSIALYIIERRVAEENAGKVIDATAVLTHDEAQQLVDDLWRAGIRPTEGKVGDRTLEAKDENLKDLREILKTVLPAALNG